MKVLLLQSKPFLPVLDGGNEASRALTKELLELDYEVEILTFSSEKHPFQRKEFEAQEWTKLSINHVPINLQTNVSGALSAMLKGNSYNLSRFTHSDWIKKIQEMKTDFDMVIIDSLYVGQEIEKIKQQFPKAKIVCRTHNVESHLWRTQADNESSILRKKYLTLLVNQLEKREKKILNQVDLILSISEIDTGIFNNWGMKNVHLLPYFPNISDSISETISPNFFFMGSMNWQPNILAHNNLTNIILPKLIKLEKEMKMQFAGGYQDQLNKSDSSHIKYLGFVNDKVKFMKESGILLAPIESGSGVRVKLLEALALGVPCVTTSKGAEGIEIKHGEGIFITQNDEEFVHFASQLHQNEDLRKNTGKQAQENLRKWKTKYNLKDIFEQNL